MRKIRKKNGIYVRKNKLSTISRKKGEKKGEMYKNVYVPVAKDVLP